MKNFEAAANFKIYWTTIFNQNIPEWANLTKTNTDLCNIIIL